MFINYTTNYVFRLIYTFPELHKVSQKSLY